MKVVGRKNIKVSFFVICTLLSLYNIIASLGSIISLELTTTTTDDGVLDDDVSDDLLLNVPFYIYEEFDWLSESSNTTIGNFTFLQWVQSSPKEKNFKEKHEDEVKFYLSALQHPMRVHQPEDAKLFLVPTLSYIITLDYVYGGKGEVPRVCNNGVCGRDLFVQLDSVLKKSTFFQRSKGSDHIVVLTSYLWRHPNWGFRKFRYINRCNVLQWGEGQQHFTAKNRIRFNTFYVGTSCDPVPYENKTDDLALIGTLWKKKNNRGDRSSKHKDLAYFKDRRDICDWTNNTNHTMTVCGSGEQCPALSNARLGFHVRGDSISANRLFDTLLSGTVPIFTLDLQYTAHQSFIDWSKVSYFIRMGGNATEASFHQQLEDILGDEESIKKKTKEVIANRDLFDWDSLVPFDVYMYMFQAELWPETRVPVNSSKYSALILPPPPPSSNIENLLDSH